ncbi:cytochrome c peroxidase [Chitinophaga varians]|uniref:cytochrome c peroxidase n=1 Tax=Chitinophaga varians TaxID=2202339 RepID=UPI00165F640D|nr:cytochrome c peroxidase [Chitinophaga varians]MBC9909390.1 cytochrome C peroxidase [Chitinophaga varians]
MRIILTALLFAALTFTQPRREPPPATVLEGYFSRQMGVVADSLEQLQQAIRRHAPVAVQQRLFRAARLSYKRAEFLTEYYYPHLIRNINGPALPFADGENSRDILPPQGFQVIEEKLWTPAAAAKELQAAVTALRTQFATLQSQTDPYGFIDAYVLDAMRFEIYRVIALGISGYDSPIALLSMPEAAAALEGVEHAAMLYAGSLTDIAFKYTLTERFSAARRYLLQHRSFNEFDRLHFITQYANPLSASLLALQQRLSLQLPPERRILSPEAPHLFAMRYYNVNGYSPNYESDPTTGRIQLGQRLFYDPLLSGNLQRSCASCHQASKAFTDGLARNTDLDGKALIARNTPTLLNAAFQSKQFYDSRAIFLENQVSDVVHNKREMNGSLQQTAHALKKDSTYVRLFAKAFAAGHNSITEENIANALASFLRSLTSLQSRFDLYMNGDATALNTTEKKGFNIFMGKAKCGTCHFAPLFSGVAPPYFAEPESEVLGVPANNRPHAALDQDPGKYVLYKISIHRYAFKTPTVRNSALTAPYMHNGVFPTLESVIDFYDKGGGAGLGIAPPNQTLPAEKLQLTPAEKKALVAFMQALTDTSSWKAAVHY